MRGLLLLLLLLLLWVSLLEHGHGKQYFVLCSHRFLDFRVAAKGKPSKSYCLLFVIPPTTKAATAQQESDLQNCKLSVLERVPQ